ncbi:MAG: hypothetical protein EOO47_20080 [Flavobacterium sp.]|nr:MAG: hypothetical protein EOO47_20080 [Flavobacterium sp.]
MNRLFLFFLSFSSLISFAQNNELNTSSKSSELFIHTDKNIYLPTETIWFSAYYLGNTDNIDLHQVLNVAISTADSGKVLLVEKYRMDYGLSMGKLMLPDSLRSGLVKLIAFTNVLDSNSKPFVPFSATLTISSQFANATKPLENNFNNPLDIGLKKNSNPILSLDKKEYDKREEVALKIKLPELSVFSIAATYDARLNEDQQKINEFPRNSPAKVTYYEAQQTTIKIKQKNKPINKVVDLVLLGNSGMRVLSTDKAGQLILNRDDILIPYGKKVALMVGGNKSNDYQIELHDPMSSIVDLLAKQNIIPTQQLNIQQNYPRTSQILGEKIIELQAVTIKEKPSSQSNTRGKAGINDCGDWVDEYGYLNYPYSEKRYHPIIGKQYKKRTDIDPIMQSFKVEPVYYNGCQTSIQKAAKLIKGINLESQFYGLDNSSKKDQYLTTLYWGAEIISDKNGQAEVRFSTAELSGMYRIILQGINSKGVCYAEAFFQVK